MKPRLFAYYAPTSLEEARTLLSQYGSRASPLAGGQALVQLMNMREVSPEVIVDLDRTSELEYLRDDGSGELAIGAMTRLQQLVTAEAVRKVNPAVTEAAKLVAFPAIRSRERLAEMWRTPSWGRSSH